MNILNLAAINAQANTGTVSSAAIPAYEMLYASVQATFTDGGAAGNLNLQASNDGTSWNTVATQAVSSGATTMIPKTDICYKQVRVQFVSVGGAGTLTATLNGMSA